MSSTRAIEQDIARWLGSRLSDGERPSPETDLVATGQLDSMLLMDLAVHLESRYDVQLEPPDFSPAHFRTVSSIARLVEARQSVGHCP